MIFTSRLFQLFRGLVQAELTVRGVGGLLQRLPTATKICDKLDVVVVDPFNFAAFDVFQDRSASVDNLSAGFR